MLPDLSGQIRCGGRYIASGALRVGDEEAFRTSRGIGWDEHGPARSRGMDLISRAVVVPALAGWPPR